MSTLLDEINEAHGGLERWQNATTIEADIAIGGPFWELKGIADFAGSAHVVADIQRQHNKLTQPSGRVMEFDKDADVATLTEPDGSTERLEHPRATFSGYTFESQFSAPQAAYFCAYATWLYLIESYVFDYPGVEIAAANPWVEDGTSWRGVRATFPPTIDAHSRTQVYYFDPEGRLARLDYEPEVNGGMPTAHYQPRQVSASAFVVTTRHEVYVRNPDRTPDRSQMAITLDMTAVTVR
ncbi:MAG TPA: hypothetical protein VMG38_15785 [Trebonia sp.]|nr:hypothetical protein [Trebonia sp.]